MKATYGSPSAGGRTLVLEVGSSRLLHEVHKTGSFDTFQEFAVGTLRLSAAGKVRLSARPVDAPKGLLINLKHIRLEPRR